MNRPFYLAFVLPTLATLLLAIPAQEPQRPSMNELESRIQRELDAHGKRVLGHDAYSWKTQLDHIAVCRAYLTVHQVSKLGEVVIHDETVEFSLGSIEATGVEPDKGWIVLPCTVHQKCITRVSSCSKTTKDGLAVDCSEKGDRREESFSLEYDGDAGAASRLQQDFRQAIELCREATHVDF
jgi:hypothetical protein